MVRSFKVPRGTGCPHGGVFQADKGLAHEPLKALPMKEFINEAQEIASRYGYPRITMKHLMRKHEEMSSECGDDEVGVSNSFTKVTFNCLMYSRMGMKVSWEDTSISPHYGNYAEDLIVLPSAYSQTWLNARNTNGLDSMAYLDVPKLRLAIDIRPMRMDHSGTNDGKASMIGSRQAWISRKSPLKGTYEAFSIFQDVNLGLHRDKKFPYLPACLGGYGKCFPFANPENFERFLHAFKQGSHSELIREIVVRTTNFLQELEGGANPAKDPLLSHLVRYQSSFHDWIKGKSIYAPVTWVDVPPEVADYQLARTGIDPLVDQAVSRLLSERRIVSEQQLQIAVEHNELCKALLKKSNILEFKAARDRARKEWQNLSIFSMESYGMIQELNLEMPNRLAKLSTQVLRDFAARISSLRGGLRQYLRSECVYSHEAMDAIYKVGPMKVNFEMQPRVGLKARGFAAPSKLYRDVEDIEQVPKLEELYQWLIGRKAGLETAMPHSAIEDDRQIIRDCANNLFNIIITDDKRLCREASIKTGSVIFRVPCMWYYLHIYYGSPGWTEYLSKISPGKEWTTHEDEGSIKSFEENYFRDGELLRIPVGTRAFNLWKSPQDWIEPEEIVPINLDDPAPIRPTEYLYDGGNILGQRSRYKPPRRQQHPSRDAGSWRKP
jgi:hypothetical protein